MKAKKKPVIIDYYIINTESSENGTKLVEWVNSFNDNFLDNFVLNYDSKTISVKTLEGTSYNVTNDDIIIRGIKGEYYPCKKDIFEATYDIL